VGFRVEGGPGARRVAVTDRRKQNPGIDVFSRASPGAMVSRHGLCRKIDRKGRGYGPCLWERLNNPDVKPIEFDGFRKQAGLHSFTLTPKQWIEKTTAETGMTIPR